MNQDTRLPSYLPFPRFLLKSDLSITAKIVYAVLLARTTLSQKSGLSDEQGHCFVIYPLAQLAEDIGRGQTVVCAALNELTRQGLIKRERRDFNKPNRIYVLLPDQTGSGDPTVGNPNTQGTENRKPDVRKTETTLFGKPTTNKKNIKQKTENNQRKTGLPDYSVWEGESL